MESAAGELHLFVRSPERGKTRLAAKCGAELAAALSAAFLRDLARLLAVDGLRTVVRLEGDRAKLPPEVDSAEIVLQTGDDLGARIAHAFLEAFGRGAELALVAGGDSPTEGPDRVEEAARHLHAGAPCVLRPAEDGGFVLLGFRAEAFRPVLLDGIPWSTDRVAAALRGNLARAGVVETTLSTGFDVDVEEDLARLAEELRRNPAAAPETARFLAEAGLLS